LLVIDGLGGIVTNGWGSHQSSLRSHCLKSEEEKTRVLKLLTTHNIECDRESNSSDNRQQKKFQNVARNMLLAEGWSGNAPGGLNRR
jgi:hypothetical protein